MFSPLVGKPSRACGTDDPLRLRSFVRAAIERQYSPHHSLVTSCSQFSSWLLVSSETKCCSCSPGCLPAPLSTWKVPVKISSLRRSSRECRRGADDTHMLDEFGSEGLFSDFIKFYFCNKTNLLTCKYIWFLKPFRTSQINKFMNEKYLFFFFLSKPVSQFLVQKCSSCFVSRLMEGEGPDCRPGSH